MVSTIAAKMFKWTDCVIKLKNFRLISEQWMEEGVDKVAVTDRLVQLKNSYNQGSMLWSQFSAIFDNFRRKNWRFSQKPMLRSKIGII
jgi:hypothetical protein